MAAQRASDGFEAVKPADSARARLAPPEENNATRDNVFTALGIRKDLLDDVRRLLDNPDAFAAQNQTPPPRQTNDESLDPELAAANALVDPASHPNDGPKTKPHHPAPPTGNPLNNPPPNLAGAGQGPGGTSTHFAVGGGNPSGGGGGGDPLHGLNHAVSESSSANGVGAAMAAQVRPAASGLTPGGDPPIPFVEGTSANQIVGTFTDSDGNTDPTKYTANIDWGNGQQTTGFVTFSSGQFQIHGVMAYAEEGNYPITTTVTDQDGAITTVTASAAVSDAPLSSTGMVSPIPATAGQAFNGSFASFTDGNHNAPTTDFSVQINWGDGQISAGTVAGSGGTYTVGGSHTYTAPGTYAVSATITDDGGSQVTINTTANVSPATTPVAVNDTYSLDQGDTLSLSAVGGVLANDSDPHGLPLSAVLVSNATHGTVSLSSDGSFTYTPTANFSGTDSFTYYATDGQQNSNTATVALDVTPTVLTAVNDSYSVEANTPRTVDAAQGVLANDTDTTGSTLSALLVSGPSNGTLTLNLDGSFTYTPNTGYTGTDSFQYEANDGTQDSNVASVSLTVHGTNTAPVAVNDSYTVQHDQIFSVDGSGVLANDSDADGDPLTASLVSGSGPAHGTLTLSPDGFFSYTPNAGYTGTDSFQYMANDGLANSAPATVTLNVTDPNPPVASNDSYGVNANTPLTVAAGIGVLANDTDADSDPLTAALVAGSGPSHGMVTLNSDGSFTYTPNTGYAGSDSFQYTASDGVLTSTATAALTVHASNTAPVASADSYSMLHDQTLNVYAAGVLSNDTDADGDPLTASVVSQPSNGTLTLNSDGSFSYTPNAGYVGTDSFQYAASDGVASSVPATVTISVTDPNAPVAVADSFSVQKNGELDTFTNTVLANDTDADGDPLTASLVSGSGPSHGSLSFNPDGSFIYIPNAGYVGTDNFQYTASDGALSSNPATVSISVTNSAPVALNDTYSVLHDTTLNLPAAGLLANDFDPDGDSLTAALATRPQHGMVTVNADGSFSYTPGAGYTGTDSFTYTASDGSLTSSPATVTITVKAANQPPSSNADSYSLPHDAPLQTTASNGVLANDTDPDGDPLLAKLTSGPSHGTLSLNVDGSFTYTPAAGYYGSDSFTYQAFDGTTVSSPATVSLTVTNDAPVANNDTISVLSSGTTAVPTNEGMLVNDTDGEDDALTAQLVSNPSHGTLTLNSDGSFNYTPGAGFTGTDSFT